MLILKNLFLPRLWHNKPLFPIRRVAIHIEATTINVAHVQDTRTKTIVTALEEYQINPGDARTYTQRLVATLKKIAPKIEKNAEVIVTFPSSKVVVKELSLPFLDEEKIRMVIEYEIEAVIPFKLENAVTDFIILSRSEVKESSNVLVIAAQKEEVKKIVDALHKADIEPHQITIDLFSIISLFSHIPTYSKLKHAYAVVDMGPQSTRIALINNQTMIATRTLLQGSELPTKINDDEIGQPIDLATHHSRLFSEISFTLDSFEIKQASIPEIEKLFFIGTPSVFNAFEEYAKKAIHCPCEVLATEQITTNPAIQSKISLQPASWQTYSRVLGAALVSPAYESFTLRRKELELSPRPLIQQQLLAGIILFTLTLGALGLQGYFQIEEGAKQITLLEEREIKRLRSALPADHPGTKKKTIKTLAREVETYVQEQEELWSAFATQRLRPLEILQELTALFNKKKFDIDIEHIIISRNDAPNPIEIKGVFRSKTGKEDFKHFTELADDIGKLAKMLILTEEIDPSQLPDKGVSFTAHFKLREGAL